MGTDLSKKVEFELTEELHECGIRDRQGTIVGPQFYVLIHVPSRIAGQLGEEALEVGYKPENKIKYRVSIERID